MKLRHALLGSVALSVLAFRVHAFPVPFTFFEPSVVGHLWPDSTNTGVPSGVTLTASGGFTASTAGATYSALNITGQVHITANNVTLKNSKVTYAILGFVVNIDDGVTGTIVKNTEINGVGTGNDGSCGIAGPGTFTANNIYNVENGICPTTGATTIQDNYIHTLVASGSPHYDGIQMDGNMTNVTISHNTIYNANNAVSATMVDNYFGPISNITINNNILLGGGYSAYCDGSFTANVPSNIQYTNNHFGGAVYGDLYTNNCTPTFTGNVDDGLAIWATLTP